MSPKKLLLLFLTLMMAFSLAARPETVRAEAAVNPDIEIRSVARNSSVTVRAIDFPTQTKFNAYMYPYGGDPDDAVLVDSFKTGSSRNFTISFDIPDDLFGVRRIILLLESPTSGHEVEASFYNRTSEQEPQPYSGFPSFVVTEIIRDEEVTLRMKNLPPDDVFVVKMDVMGTQAKNGIAVGRFSTGDGGTRTASFEIPSELWGDSRIAIRIQSPYSGLYYYNWFYNKTSGASGGSSGKSTTWGDNVSRPSISLVNVVKDQSVTFWVTDLPPRNNYEVLLSGTGPSGEKTVLVFTVKSPPKPFTGILTIDIPADLLGAAKINIRVENESNSRVYASVWFNNKTSK